jgi:hypothetical protein
VLSSSVWFGALPRESRRFFSRFKTGLKLACWFRSVTRGGDFPIYLGSQFFSKRGTASCRNNQLSALLFST